MHKNIFNMLTLKLKIKPRSPLLIKAGVASANPSLPEMQFVRTTHYVKGEILYIPGSSLKGVFRSYSEKILRTLKGEPPDGSCNIIEKNSSCTKRLEENKISSSPDIYRNSCRVCKLFGNGKLKSRIVFNDAYPEYDLKNGNGLETRYSVSISRLSQSVASGPFDIETVVKGSFETQISLTNFESWQIGLLSLTINGLNNELVKLGYGKNRGFGSVLVEIGEVNFTYPSNIQIPKSVILGVGKLAADEAKNYGFIENDILDLQNISYYESEENIFRHRKYDGTSWDKISEASIRKLKEVLSR